MGSPLVYSRPAYVATERAWTSTNQKANRTDARCYRKIRAKSAIEAEIGRKEQGEGRKKPKGRAGLL